MSRYYERNDSGYTRGGLDVVTGINLFFKGILIFPILMLAVYIGLAMMKHMLWNGIPHMNSTPPTEEVSVVEPSREVAPVQLPPPTPYQYESSTGVSHAAAASNCKYSPVCPPGGENRVGANGRPYVWPTATPVGVDSEETWITTIEEDPFQ